MKHVETARPFVPTEIHGQHPVGEKGTLGTLSVRRMEGSLDIAVDRHAVANVVNDIRGLSGRPPHRRIDRRISAAYRSFLTTEPAGDPYC